MTTTASCTFRGSRIYMTAPFAISRKISKNGWSIACMRTD